MAPEGFWLFLPGCEVTTTPFSIFLAHELNSDSHRTWRSITGTGTHSPSHVARILLHTVLQFCQGLENRFLYHLLFALFEFLFEFTSRFLFLCSALPWFHSLPHSHLILFICLFCSFSFHPSVKRVLSPLSAPVFSIHLQ